MGLEDRLQQLLCAHMGVSGCVHLYTRSQGLKSLPPHSPGRLPSHSDYNHSQPGTLTKHHIPPPWTTSLFDLLSGGRGEGQSAGARGTLPSSLDLAAADLMLVLLFVQPQLHHLKPKELRHKIPRNGVPP